MRLHGSASGAAANAGLRLPVRLRASSASACHQYALLRLSVGWMAGSCSSRERGQQFLRAFKRVIGRLFLPPSKLRRCKSRTSALRRRAVPPLPSPAG